MYAAAALSNSALVWTSVRPTAERPGGRAPGPTRAAGLPADDRVDRPDAGSPSAGLDLADAGTRTRSGPPAPASPGCSPMTTLSVGLLPLAVEVQRAPRSRGRARRSRSGGVDGSGVVLAVEPDDHVADLEAGLVGGAAGLDLGDDRAAGVGELVVLGEGRR